MRDTLARITSMNARRKSATDAQGVKQTLPEDMYRTTIQTLQKGQQAPEGFGGARDIYNNYNKDYNLGDPSGKDLGWSVDKNTGYNTLSLGGQNIGGGYMTPENQTMVQADKFSNSIQDYINRNNIQKRGVAPIGGGGVGVPAAPVGGGGVGGAVAPVGSGGAPIAPISLQPQGYNGNDANNIVNNDKIRAWYDKVMNAPEFQFDPNTYAPLQSVKAMYMQEGDRAARNNLARMMNASGGGGGMSTAAASAAATAQNDANNRFMGLVPQMYQNAYSQYQAQRANDLSNLNTAMGIDTTQYNRARNAISDTNAAEDRKRKLYEESVAGLGKQYDYSQGILDNQNDGDTSNDWQIPILQKHKEIKIAGMVNDFKANVNQYYNDFQAAINNLEAEHKINPNDPIYEQKKAILLAAKAAKEEKMRQDALAANKYSDEKAQWEKKFGLEQSAEEWKQNPDNPANIKKLEAANKVPAMTTAQKNQYRAEAYTALKKLSPEEAKSALEFKREEIESTLGYSGYVSLYNDILRGGVESGNTNKYDASPKEPGTVSWMDQYMSDLLGNVQKP